MTRLATRLKLFAAAFVFGISIGTVGLSQQQLNAVGWCGGGWYSGYFWCGGTSGSYNVINDGLPTWIDTKQEFIDYVLGKYYAGSFDIAGNIASMDKTGAAYIIQTMRGGSDHDFPDGSDINDWINRINNPSVSLSWGWESANINSRRTNLVWSPVDGRNHRDIMGYNGDGASYWSLRFIVNGSVRYIVKQTCANPLGGLGGLPSPNYNLTPTINVSPDSGEAGSQVQVSPSVANAGPTASSNVAYAVTRFTLEPDEAVPPGGDSSATASVFYGHGATSVQTGSQVFQLNNNPITVPSQTLPDLDVGDRVCYALSVRPYNQSTGNARHSTPDCVVIAKEPKVQIIGGDLLVGKQTTSQVITSATTKSGRTYGSWVEYAAAVSGSVTGLASGAGYSNGGSTQSFCDVSLLTFTNAGTSVCTTLTAKGGYSINTGLPAVGDWLSATSNRGTNPSIDLTALGNGSYGASGAVNLTASGEIQVGRWVVINAPTATVNINSNISYDSDTPLQSIGQIPQVVIIANQINIGESVNRVDAWLVATGVTGSINTCGEITNPSSLNAGRCSNALTVNGPVVARHLYLYRTAGAGSGAATGEPAEIFNLRPDAYLWATARAAESGRLPTASTTELPPRF